MPLPSHFVYRPSDIVADLPALEPPALELGLLDEDFLAAGIRLDDLPTRLCDLFPDVTLEPMRPGDGVVARVVSVEDLLKPRPMGRSGTRFQDGKPVIHIECVDGQVNAVDLLREFGCMVEGMTTRLLTLMQGLTELTLMGNGRCLAFSRTKTPSYFLETAGFKFPDHARGYVNRHAAVLQSLAIALLTRTDLRLVLLDVLVAAREDPMMLKLLTALAFRSNVDFRDRRELEEYAAVYWNLSAGENETYCNLHQVNDAASYYARQLRAHVRALIA